MSRRQSRNSLNIRQTDPLVEFEAFKKKFLLANKHITKLNSTLSVRIEELNGQISTLYVENLRLRASEIALTAQLKKEKEKSRRIMADAEAATSNLAKHLSRIRQSFNIAPGRSSPSPSPPQVKATTMTLLRPTPAASASTTSSSPPQPRRLARVPDVPSIEEEEDREDEPPSPGPVMRREKPRDAIATTPVSVIQHPSRLPVTVEGRERRKKPTRRQSGLLNGAVRNNELDLPRAGSPVPGGSPMRREIGLALELEEQDEDEDEDVAVILDISLIDSTNSKRDPFRSRDMPLNSLLKGKEKEGQCVRSTKEKNVKGRDVNMGVETESSSSSSGSRERDQKRLSRASGNEDSSIDAVSEAPRAKVEKKLKDVTNSPTLTDGLSGHDRRRTSVQEHDSPSIDLFTTALGTRTFLAVPSTPTSDIPVMPSAMPQSSHLPSPRPSASPPPGVEMLAEDATKSSSVGSSGREKRARRSVNYTEPKLNTKMRKPDPPPGTLSSTKPRSSATDHASPEQSEERAQSVHAAVAGTSKLAHPTPPPAPAPGPTPSSSSSTGPTAVLVVKRKKSRSRSNGGDEYRDDSDGAQADVELSGTRMSLDNRRKSSTLAMHSESTSLWDGRARRNSMAV